jgi:hypothetical protein
MITTTQSQHTQPRVINHTSYNVYNKRNNITVVYPTHFYPFSNAKNIYRLFSSQKKILKSKLGHHHNEVK